MTDPVGIYFDGKVAARREVSIDATGGALTLHECDVEVARWPESTLREVEARHGQLKLRSVTAPELAHVTISDENAISHIRRLFPSIKAEDIRHRTPVWRIISLSGAAALSVLLAIVFIIPLMAGLLAELVPASMERKLGDQIADQLQSMYKTKVCSSPGGNMALGRLSAQLTDAGDMHTPVRINVLDTSMKNAIALPGGQVFLFDGLLQAAANIDEIAGVLGHEIGHQAARDGLKGFFRSGGTAFLLGLLVGDVSGSWAVIFASKEMIESANSREAEAAADDFAQKAMHKLGRPAASVAELLVRISGQEQKSIFSSHPMSAERLEKLKHADAAATVPLNGKVILTDAEWQSLKRICKDD